MRERPRPKSEERAKAGSGARYTYSCFSRSYQRKRTPANRRKSSISVTKADCRIVSKNPPRGLSGLKQRTPVKVYSPELQVLR